ncbi:hypothetical protein ABPG72_000277 [Tetrahymena utriculariae]
MSYIEIFELNQHSTQGDLQHCIDWIQENFKESKFINISIVIKRSESQHLYIEELCKDEKVQSDGKKKGNNISLKKVTLQEMEKQTEQKKQTKILDNQQYINQPGDLANLSQEVKTYQNNGNEEGNQKVEQFDELKDMFNKTEQLLNSKQYEQATELQAKIQTICKQLIEKIEENHSTAYKNYRSRQNQDSKEEEKDQEMDSMYLQLITLFIDNYIKQGKCQLLQNKSDAAINFFNQGIEFYNQVKNKKLIVKKYNLDVMVDYVINPHVLEDLYSSLGDTYHNQKVYDKSIENFQFAIQIIDRYSNEQQKQYQGQKKKGDLYNLVGYAYYCIGDIQKAIESFTQSLQICMELNGEEDVQVANRMNNLAEAYRSVKQYEKALKYFFKSLEIKKKGEMTQKNIQSLGKTCQNIGFTYQDSKQYEKAIEYYMQSIEYYKQFFTDHYKDEGGSTLNVLYTSTAECYNELNNFQEATKIYEKVYEINKSMFGLKNIQTINCANILATLLFRLQLFEKSVELFEQILGFQKQYYGEQSIQVVQTLVNMGTIFCKMQKYELGIEKIDMALKILEQNPKSDQQTIESTKQSKLYYQKKFQQFKQFASSSQSKRDLKIEEL